jgi:hypothetical protein
VVDSYEIFRNGAHAQFAVEEIASTLTYLHRLAKITKVVWIGPYIQSRINVNNPSNWYQSNSISEVVVNSFRELDSYLKKVWRRIRFFTYQA